MEIKRLIAKLWKNKLTNNAWFYCIGSFLIGFFWVDIVNVFFSECPRCDILISPIPSFDEDGTLTRKCPECGWSLAYKEIYVGRDFHISVLDQGTNTIDKLYYHGIIRAD